MGLTVGEEGPAVGGPSGEGHRQTHVLEDGDHKDCCVLTAHNVGRFGVGNQRHVPEGKRREPLCIWSGKLRPKSGSFAAHPGSILVGTSHPGSIL